MNDAAYCAYGCPGGKLCALGDPNIGCVVGTELLHNPGRPRCCEVDNDYHFLDTVRAILHHGNTPFVVQRNAGTGACRQALGQLLDSINAGGYPAQTFISNGTLDIPTHAQFPTHMIDDMVQLMHMMVPDSGLRVKMEFDDIVRQPLVLREEPRNLFKSHEVPIQQLPNHALTVAARLQVFARGATGAQAVMLVIHALSNPDPSTNPATDTELRLEFGCDPKITRRHVTMVRNAMQSTRFVGKVSINSLPNPFQGDVQLGQFQVAAGKDINVSAHGMEITIN